MKIKKGDTIRMLSGKDRGKTGKVLRSIPKENKVVVEGLNIVKKNRKPKKQGEKGQIINLATPVNSSRVILICPKCNKPARVGYKMTKDKKYRICKKCKSEIE